MPRSNDAVIEDLAFLQDQRTMRRGVISDKYDIDMQQRVERRIKRYERMRSYEEKCRVNEYFGLDRKVDFEMDEVISHNSDEFEASGSAAHQSSVSSDSDLDFQERGETQLPTHTKLKRQKHSKLGCSEIAIEFDRDNLILATTPVNVRCGISIRSQTMFLGAVIKALGGNVNDLNISRSSVARSRFKYIEDLGTTIRSSYYEEMAGKNLILHFDSKLVKEIKEKLKITVKKERVAISVTSPEFTTKDDRLLGIIPVESTKGKNQAIVIQNILEYFEIADNIIGVCTDTTSSNTGRLNGAIIIISRILNKCLFWFMCRHHIYELHINHAIQAITKVKSKGPSKSMYLAFQRNWETSHESVNSRVPELKIFDWNKLEIGSKLHILALAAKDYAKYSLENKIFSRNDYNHLVKYLAFYLGVESDKLKELKIHQPGACHEARFMADALYILSLEMTSTVISFLPDENKKEVETCAFIVAVCYAPWYLKSRCAEHAVLNDFNAFKAAYVIKDEFNADIGNALIKSFHKHSWYLSPAIVVFSLVDSHLEMSVKYQNLNSLISFPVPEQKNINMEKPNPVLILPNSKLSELVTADSWLIFLRLGITNQVKDWVSSHPNFSKTESYGVFEVFVKGLSVTNDCAERNIGLLNDFFKYSQKEEQRQNILLIAREERKKVTKNVTQKELINI
ncbi:uncharacterized protein LOC136076810 [Hydra vulgaris]|uniref:Uncharacterized protein LOC136076810 n=1 Tax=Hydra vulgaris TaxID=6087 RepID=A0ABM4BBP8_HYDVU